VLRRRTFFYGWVVVVVAAVVLLATAGVRAAPGALLVTMETEPGWSTSALSFAAAIGLVVFGLSGPLSGRLMGRYGIRAVVLASLVITAVSLVAAANAQDIWQIALFFGLLSGFGTGLVASVVGPTIANRWFEQRRGFVTGIFGASTSVGQLIFFPFLTGIAVAIGWRSAVLSLAVLAVLLLIPVLIWFRNDPADIGTVPLGATPGAARPALGPEPGVMRRAVHSADFWFLAITFFVCGATSNGLIGQHFINHAVLHGFTPVVASGALALMGAFNFVGTLASGWLTDRWDPRKLLLAYYGFRGVSLLFLPFVTDSFGIIAFSVLFGLDYIATVPPTVMLAADTFGRRNVGVVFGWIFASHQFGAAIAAWGAGLVRDSVGDYSVAFVAAGWIAIVAGFMALRIGRPRAIAVAPSASTAA
jgi:predicted MFS family arabinose efflux permease